MRSLSMNGHLLRRAGRQVLGRSATLMYFSVHSGCLAPCGLASGPFLNSLKTIVLGKYFYEETDR